MLIEPEAAFARRHAHIQEDAFAFTDADHLILNQLRGGPVRLTTVLNITARAMPARCKRRRMAIKHEILLRLGEMIRQGRLRRVRRRFIALPR